MYPEKIIGSIITLWHYIYRTLFLTVQNLSNSHEAEVNNKARVLYSMYFSGESFYAKKNCLKFEQLEKMCDRYNADKE